MSPKLDALLEQHSQQLAMELANNAAYVLILIDPESSCISHTSNLKPELQVQVFAECTRIVAEHVPEVHMIHPGQSSALS